MSNEIIEQQQDKKEIAVTYEINGNEIKLTQSIVQQYIVSGDKEITQQEFMLFAALCKAHKLNPFLREAYCIKFSDKNPAQMVVGKDAIIKRAIINPNFNGMESGIIVLTDKNEVVERKGTFKLSTDKLVGGWARVYRKNWDYPTYCSVSFDEVAQKKDGALNSNWANKGATMVEKVAKVRALRETFSEDLSGMYEAEETGVELKENEPNKVVIEQGEPTPQITGKTETVSMDDID